MKKALIILLAILAVAGMLAGCERTENALQEQLRKEVEWYDYTTRFTVEHVYDETYVLTATHVYEDGLVGIDVWITVPDIDTGGYKFRNIYNGGQIN
jgi:lipopolysaccharide export system protein LptC